MSMLATTRKLAVIWWVPLCTDNGLPIRVAIFPAHMVPVALQAVMCNISTADTKCFCLIHLPGTCLTACPVLPSPCLLQKLQRNMISGKHGMFPAIIIFSTCSYCLC